MTGGPARADDPYPAYDVRLDGDPGSCHAAAAALRAATRGADDLGAAADDVVAHGGRLADALDRFATELRRAQTDHARACAVDPLGTDRPGDRAADERNAALALAARARRRLRIASADILPAGRYGCPP